MKKLLLLTILLIAFQAKSQWAGAYYDTLTHNSLRDELNHQCIDIDKTGKLHVVYKRENPVSGWSFFYRQRDLSSVWSPEDSVASDVGFDPVIAASNIAGDAYVAYEGGASSIYDIFLSSYSAGLWTNQQITNDAAEDMTPTIDVDSAGYVHLAWTSIDSFGNYLIKYATNIGGVWRKQELSANQLGLFGSGAIPEIAVEKPGIAHIVYRGGVPNAYKIYHAFNNAPGDSTWTYDILTTSNMEDLQSAIAIDHAENIHVLVSGDDGFGFPVNAFYLKKPFGSPSFEPAVRAASAYHAAVGDLFIDSHDVPHIVLNELSGNFLTGNIIYADSTDWTGITLLQTNDVYEAHLVIDADDHAYMAGFRGNSFADEEIIVYGADNTTGMDILPSKNPLMKIITTDNNIRVIFNTDYNGILNCMGVDGKTIYKHNGNYRKDEFINITNVSSGIYFITAASQTNRSVIKIAVR